MARVMRSVAVGVETLRANPLRTVLSTLGVVIGVAALVAVLSLGDGMENYARSELAKTTSVQNVFVNPVTSDTVDGIRVARETVPIFSLADARDARAAIPGVSAVSMTYSGVTFVQAPDGRRRAARVTAALPSTAAMYDVKAEHGRFFTEAETEANAPVVVVSPELAEALSPGAPAAVVGKAFEFRGGARTVVGVLPKMERAEQGMAAYVPLPGGAAVMSAGEAGRPRTLVLQARTVEEVEAVERAAKAWLTRRFGSERDFVVGTDRARTEQMMQGFLAFKLFMGAITAISLLVGGIGIMNVLLASVTERTREIGIRKAVGARKRDILLQFLSESVAITGSGSLLGLLLGVATAFGVTAAMRSMLDAPIHAGLSLSTVLVAAGSALVIGLSFGTYPALRAARLSPIDAIRHE